MTTIRVRAPVPQNVTRFQAMAVLLTDGVLADVEALIAQSDPLTQLAWREASFSRSSPTVSGLGALMGWDDDALDELFRRAGKVSI